MKLKIAMCQFPIDRDIRRNLGYVERQMVEAQRRGAHVAHFPECALSGYPGVEFKSFDGFDWDLLAESTLKIMALARRLRVWVILGSSHRLSGGHKPHNSLYVIDDRGGLVDRYDKRFCTGDRSGKSGDLAHFSPGDHFVTFRIRGVKCGLIICHDFRYDELYREYKRLGVQLMFHSYHNGHTSKSRLRRAGNIWGVIVPPTMQAYAANNYLWISANNTTARESSWPSFFVRPDGVITGRLANHRPGILITTVDTRAKLYDASEAWRDRAMRSVYHSGTLVRDKRSSLRTAL
jgi:predicted amidohydrolase